MTSSYSVKIGGSPSAPGNAYDSATRLRYGRGINRPGMCEFDLIGLNGQAEPTEGMYLQVLYGATVVWDGFVREVQRKLDDIDRHVTAMDALGELDRRDVDARVAYSAQNEGAIGTDILNQVGITAATTPIRTGTMNAGNVFGSYRVQYANALKALRSLASINGRELTAEYDAGTGTTKIHMRSRVGDYAASQATWKAAQEILNAKLQRDNWEQLDNVRVLGQGDGTSASDTYGASTGAGGSNKAVVPAKNLNDSTVAGSMAATLKAAFNDPRLLVECPLLFFNLEVDQGINVGDRVTIQDYAGVSYGDFRVFFLETDPEYTDGWFTKVTLIRATTVAGADYPALPSVTTPDGAPQGISDQMALLNDPLTYQQITDLVPQVLEVGVTSVTVATVVNVAVPAGALAVAIATKVAGIPANLGLAEAFLLEFFVGSAAGATATANAHTHQYDKTDTPTGATDAAGGGATAEPHTHGLTYTPTATGAASANGVTVQGPFILRVQFWKGGVAKRIFVWAVSHLPVAAPIFLNAMGTYPFAYKDAASGSYTPDTITFEIDNLGPVAITIAAGSQAIVYKKDLHNHNS